MTSEPAYVCTFLIGLFILLCALHPCWCFTRFVTPGNINVLTFETDEEQPNGTLITTLIATTDSSNEITYSLEPKISNILEVHPSTGVLKNVAILDFEKDKFYDFKAFASTSPSDKASVDIILALNNINDNVPLFGQDLYFVTVSENAPIGTFLLRCTAADADEQDILFYTITDGDLAFRINQYTGDVYTLMNLDYESKKEYSLELSVTDGLWVRKAILKVLINDFDDQGAKFEQTVYNVTIEEGHYADETFLAQVHAYDLDTGINASVTYELIESTFGTTSISINRVSGQVYIMGTVDYELMRTLNIYVTATSTSHSPDRTKVTVNVIDVNDNKPEFTQSLFSGKIAENSLDGSLILRVTAIDNDEGANSLLDFRITNTEKVPFQITPAGDIVVHGELDREKRDAYLLKIIAEEVSTIEKYSAATTVAISVIDVNDNTPVFAHPSIDLNIDENINPPYFLTQIVASDVDIGMNKEILYHLTSKNGKDHTCFTMNNKTGNLLTNHMFDRENQSEYHIQVVAEDQAQQGLRRSSTMEILISINDLNDNFPRFEKSFHEIFVLEAVATNTTIITIFAHDPDFGKNGNVHYKIIKGKTSAFDINTSTGELSTITYLDRETHDKYNMTINATDGGGKSSSCHVYISVLDSNDNRPVFEKQYGYDFNVTEGEKGAYVGTIKATDADEGIAGMVFYMITEKDLFFINASTGDIYTKEILDREMIDTHIFTGVAMDSVVTFRSNFVQIRVKVTDRNDNPPLFPEKAFPVMVHSGMQAHAVIYTLTSNDLDLKENAETDYTSSNIPDFLFLVQNTGVIKLSKSIPLGTDIVSFNVTAANRNEPSYQDTATIRLIVVSTNNDAPIFSQQVFYASITENADIGTTVFDLNATYQGNDETHKFVYMIESGGNETFSVDQSNGKVTSSGMLDRECIAEYTLVVSVSLSSTYNYATLVINILDMNDNAPYFTTHLTTVYIQENMASFYHPPWVHCDDVDIENNAKITYFLQGHSNILRIDKKTGIISLKKSVDHEEMNDFNLTVVCINDQSSDVLVTQQQLYVHVVDVNDNKPLFEEGIYDVNITENTYLNSVLVHTKASDYDSELNGRLHFKISSVSPATNCFTIEGDNGKIRTTCSFDREVNGKYTLIVTASDAGSPSLSTSVHVNVNILDVNDNIPILHKNLYRFNVLENLPPRVIGKIDVTDEDDEPPCRYCRLMNDHGVFAIKPNGELESLHSFDREKNASFEFELRIYHEDETVNKTTNFASCNVTVNILDVNDNSPVFPNGDIYVGVKDSSQYGSVIAKIEAIDLDEVPGLVYNITSGNQDGIFDLNPKTGELKTTFNLFHVKESRTVIIKARDNKGIAPSLLSANHIAVHVMVFDDSTMGSFTTSAHPTFIEAHIAELERLLSNLTNAYTKIYRTLPGKQNGESEIEFYAINIATRRMLPKQQLTDSLLETWLNHWNISSVGVASVAPIIQEVNNERELYIGIILGVSLLVVFLIIFSVYLWLRGGKSQRPKEEPTPTIIGNSRIPITHQASNESANGTQNRYYIETYESTQQDPYYDTMRYHPNRQEFPPSSFYADESHDETNSASYGGVPSGQSTLKHGCSWMYGEEPLLRTNEPIKSKGFEQQNNTKNVVSTPL